MHHSGHLHKLLHASRTALVLLLVVLFFNAASMHLLFSHHHQNLNERQLKAQVSQESSFTADEEIKGEFFCFLFPGDLELPQTDIQQVAPPGEPAILYFSTVPLPQPASFSPRRQASRAPPAIPA